MRIKKSLSYIGLLCFCVSNLMAQENGKFHRLILENGLNIQTTLEQRYTSNAQNNGGFHTRSAYEFGNSQKLNRIEMHFFKNFEKRENITYFINLNSGLRYTHLRQTKLQPFKVGGYADIGSALIFPIGRWSENSPIAYTIWSSIGVAAHWQRKIKLTQKTMNLSIEGAFPLLAYVIRPAHAHPYPSNYLVDGIFDFDRKGMTKYLLKSGQLKTLNQFNNFRMKTTLAVPYGQKAHQIGLSYNWEFLWKGGEQKLWQTQHQLSIYLKINFK